MRNRSLLVLFILTALAACSTGQRNLRSHPAVFAEPYEDFVVLVPFNRPDAQAAANTKKPVKVASLGGVPPGVITDESTQAADTFTAILHDFRAAQDAAANPYPYGAKKDDTQKPLLERMAKGIGGDVAAVRFHCVEVERDDSTLRRLRKATVRQDRCTYISADMRDLLTIPASAVAAPDRNQIVDMLLNASDYNCSNFLVRAFAKKTNLDSKRSTLQDIGTGLATIVASPAPALSAGVGLTNLVTGSAVDNYNASFYLEKTFQVMESAIGKERATVRARIVQNTKKPANDYGLYAALNDVRAYDDACSIERGLSILSEMTAVQRDDAEKRLNGAADPIAEQKRQLQAFIDQVNATIQKSVGDGALVTALENQRKAVEDALRRLNAQSETPTPQP